MSRLPQGWVSATVGDLVEAGPKNECPDSTEVGFVPMSRMGTRFLDVPNFEVRHWSAVKRGYTAFADGDVLLARITPCFENGKAGIPEGLPNGLGAGSTEYLVLRPKRGVLSPRYLLALLKSQKFLYDGKLSMTGAVGQQRVPKARVLSYPMPVAPYNEQLRIAAKLDATLEQVDACRERLERIPGILARFRESILKAAVTGRLTRDWRSHNRIQTTGEELGTIARQQHRKITAAGKGKTSTDSRQDSEDLKVFRKAYGVPGQWGLVTAAEAVSPRSSIIYGILQPGPDVDGGVPYVQGVDVEKSRIRIDSLSKTTRKIADQYTRSILAAGDIVLCIIRNIKVALVPPELEGANISRTMARLRPLGDVIRPEYFAAVLESPVARQWFGQFFRGIDMPGLNLRDVRRLPVPLPPLEEQDEIIRRLRGTLALAASVERQYEEAVAKVAKLTPAVLAKAFRGTLVPQDPNDEPAQQLLERVRANGSEVMGSRSITARAETGISKFARPGTSHRRKRATRATPGEA